MPLPLILLGAGLVGAAAAVGAANANEKAKKSERARLALDETDPHVNGKNGAVKLPSEILTSDITVKPVPGAIVSCSVFSAFDHTGIWMENNVIVELHGTGLIKAVSPQRFLNNRSGSAMFVACDSQGEPLVADETMGRAANEIYNYWQYDMVKNNCYRFCWQCISGDDRKVATFTEFNNALAQLHGKKVYWDKALLD